MKFKIGDRIKYGSDEWLFYGTVSAIIENSISPLYRINVERMEKNNCKFSITQFEFEFELVADTDINTKKDTEIEDLNNYEELNDDNSTVAIISEPEVKEINGKIHSQEQRKYQTKISKLWMDKLKLYQKGEKNNRSMYKWAFLNRLQYKEGNLSEDKYKKLKAINFPFESDKNTKNFRVITKKWNEKYESYRNGDMNSLIYSWMFNNRALYKAGKLSEVKYKKLQEINFPFESIVDKKKYAIISKPEIDDSWNAKYELYRKGDKSEDLNIWKSENRKQFIDGKLPEAKYEK